MDQSGINFGMKRNDPNFRNSQKCTLKIQVRYARCQK